MILILTKRTPGDTVSCISEKENRSCSDQFLIINYCHNYLKRWFSSCNYLYCAFTNQVVTAWSNYLQILLSFICKYVCLHVLSNFIDLIWKSIFQRLLMRLLRKLINSGDSATALWLNINSDFSLFTLFSEEAKYFSSIINLFPQNLIPITKT